MAMRGKIRTDLTNHEFGRWTVLGEGIHKYYGKHRRLYWRCRCKCGTVKEVSGSSLTKGISRSCGCRHSEQSRARLTTHGKSKHPLYSVWWNMLNRCRREKDRYWASYGGRGIKVCDQWKKFAAFFNDMAAGYRPGLTLDRIDQDGHYEPFNVRWANAEEQANNKRNNHLVEFNGETKTVAVWSKEFGIRYGTLSERLRKGWSVERAFII